MNGCQGDCPREAVQQNAGSLGIIGGSEIIVRGAHDPRSGNAKTHLVRSAVIPKDDLYSGNFSVWRLEPNGIKCCELADRLDQIPQQKLFALCGVSAKDLRGIKVGDVRALSIVDEIECDRNGGTHAAHAHIALCKSLVAAGVDKTHPDFEQIRTELHGKLKKNLIWLRWDAPTAAAA